MESSLVKQVLRTNRVLPLPGTILTPLGTLVDPQTVVAELDYIPGAMQRIDTAQFLGVSVEEFREKVILSCSINDYVAKGAVLAEHSVFFCTKEVRSPIDAYVALISPHQGAIYLRSGSKMAESNEVITLSASDMRLSNQDFVQSFIPSRLHLNRTGRYLSNNDDMIVMAGQRLFLDSDMVAPYTCRVVTISEFDGEITLEPVFQTNHLKANLHGYVAAVSEEGVYQIASYGYHVMGVVGYGGEQCGSIFPIDTRGSTLHEADLTNDIVSLLQGKIVVCRGNATLRALQLLAQSGVSGLILGSLDIDVIASFTGHNPLQRMGELMPIPYPIMMIQGFKGFIPPDQYNTLVALSNRQSLINANTQLRAGVVRPSLLVPIVEELDTHREEILEHNPLVEIAMSLNCGDKVLLLREPHLGEYAIVEQIGSRLERADTGIMTVMAKVKLLESNVTISVALSNCKKAY